MNFIPLQFIEALPPPPVRSVVEWAEHSRMKLPGSARSETFDSNITPWTREPLECGNDGITRICTFVKPVQSGGSVIGEVLINFFVTHTTSGDIQYNWEDDEKADARWDKRIERILKGCPEVMQLWPVGNQRHKAMKGLVMFHNRNLTCQGVFSEKNVASDSIRFQVNEEIHLWESGRLAQAYNRTTAFWNSVIFNISNASTINDQLHQAFQSGTQQHWEVKCPGCGEYHAMFTRHEKDRPGGLCYDSTGCRREDGSYDYNRLAGTIHYEFPCCLYHLFDDTAQRRSLSLSGRYSSPRNTGANLAEKSFTLEAVAVDYIPWLKLIQEKHEALKALRYGDPVPWIRYLQERECKFWNPEDRPLVGKVTLNTSLRKDRAGLPNRHARFFALDRQQGHLAAGELPHWWLVIRDAMPSGDSLLVFEGKLLTDEDVIETLRRHDCVMRHGVADSGDDTVHVYQFCLRHGINAIKGEDKEFFAHTDDGSKKIFSPEKPLHLMINAPATCTDPIDEPQFFFYSKHGIRERLAWLRAGKEVKWEVPGDASEDYKSHMEAEEVRERRAPRDGSLIYEWVQVKRRNDLFVCECYVAMLMEMAGLIGEGVLKRKDK